jgi:hypothetical protein
MKQVIVAGLFSLMILSVLLPGESFSREDGNVVDVENSVPVKDEAVAEARSNAIQGALQKAAEQATGSWLTPEIMREKAKTLRGNIFLKADQYIQNYRIISENAYAGVYTLIVRVTVSLDSIKNDLRTLGLGKELPPGSPSVPVLITIRGIKNYQDYSQLREFMKTGLKVWTRFIPAASLGERQASKCIFKEAPPLWLPNWSKLNNSLSKQPSQGIMP